MAEMQPLDESDETKVDASPTKRFFVDIITRDILIDLPLSFHPAAT